MRWCAGGCASDGGRRGFLRALNRMMFLAAEPTSRYRVLERFYSLPEPLIERFYAGSPSWTRTGRDCWLANPPMPISRALRALPACRGPEAGALRPALVNVHPHAVARRW